jgi:hypothetical protein
MIIVWLRKNLFSLPGIFFTLPIIQRYRCHIFNKLRLYHLLKLVSIYFPFIYYKNKISFLNSLKDSIAEPSYTSHIIGKGKKNSENIITNL